MACSNCCWETPSCFASACLYVWQYLLGVGVPVVGVPGVGVGLPWCPAAIAGDTTMKVLIMTLASSNPILLMISLIWLRTARMVRCRWFGPAGTGPSGFRLVDLRASRSVVIVPCLSS